MLDGGWKVDEYKDELYGDDVLDEFRELVGRDKPHFENSYVNRGEKQTWESKQKMGLNLQRIYEQRANSGKKTL